MKNLNTDGKQIGWKIKDGIDRLAVSKALGFSEILLEYEGYDFILESETEYNARRLGLLHLLFEPVYEEKFKVGDYVYVINGGLGALGASSRVGKISSKKPSFGRCYLGIPEEGSIVVDIDDNVWALSSSCKIRKATQQEIETVARVNIILRHSEGTFEIEVSKKRGIRYIPEDKSLDVNRLRYILNHTRNTWRSGYNISDFRFIPLVTHIDSGCKKNVPIEDWMKVLEAYDSFN